LLRRNYGSAVQLFCRQGADTNNRAINLNFARAAEAHFAFRPEPPPVRDKPKRFEGGHVTPRRHRMLDAIERERDGNLAKVRP
jgi:hypothetical protein